MTREEAIEAIQFGHCNNIFYYKIYEEAIEMAIEALEQPKMDNKALLDKLKQLEPFNNTDVPEWVIDVIERWQ